MRTVIGIAALHGLLAIGLMALACGDDGAQRTPEESPNAPSPQSSPEAPSPEAAAQLSIEKGFVEMDNGELRFTIVVSNVGEAAARDVTIRDVWQEGLVVTRIQQVDGEQPKTISDTGLELFTADFPPDTRKRLVYDARCDDTGSWVNKAEVTAANLAEPLSKTTTVECP